jgi:dCTP deaminase
MILNDVQTQQRAMILPYEQRLQNGESYDLTLGKTIKIRQLMPWWKIESWDIFTQPDGSKFIARKASWETIDIGGTSQSKPYWVKPGMPFLACSEQWLKMPNDLVGIGFLKSSRARELLEHLQAVFVDATFEGVLTFEFVNMDVQPKPIWQGQRVMQLAFAKTTPAIAPYKEKGHYMLDGDTQESKGYFA